MASPIRLRLNTKRRPVGPKVSLLTRRRRTLTAKDLARPPHPALRRIGSCPVISSRRTYAILRPLSVLTRTLLSPVPYGVTITSSKLRRTSSYPVYTITGSRGDPRRIGDREIVYVLVLRLRILAKEPTSTKTIRTSSILQHENT
jgi:hypothetical protein